MRTILKYLILTTYDLVPLLLLIGAFLSVVEFEKRKLPKFLFAGGFVIGLILAVIQFVLKQLYPKKLNLFLIRTGRWNTLVIMVVITVFMVWLLIELRNREKRWMMTVRDILGGVLIAFLVSGIFPGVIRYATEFVYFGEKTFSTMSLMRAIGYILGISVALLSLLGIRRLTQKESYRFRKIVLTLLSLTMTVHYILAGITDAAKLRLVKMSKVFTITVISDKFNFYTVFIMTVICILAAICITVRNWKLKGEFANNALRRKEKARLRSRRRWSYFVSLMAVLTIFIGTAVKAYDEREEHPTPPETYEDAGDKIIIPLNLVEDGHLHRYALAGKENPKTEIKFLVVRKPNSNSYGLGLDACEICGVAGYIERKDEVVCKKCDVVMNKATIGFKGGCNPIPFDYKVEDGKIIIEKEELWKHEDVFK